jgi:zinc protease
VLGSEASIRQMRREAVLGYYKSFYVPGNMVLLVMGDFDTPEMMRLVKKTFGTAPKGAKVPLSGGRWPKPGASNFSTSRLEAGRVYLHAAFPIRTAPWEAKTQAAELLVAALADGKDSPLSEALTAGADPLVISYSFAVAPRRVPWSTAEFEAVIPKGKDPQLVLRRLAEGIVSLRPGSGAWDRIASARTAAKADEVLTADQIQYFSMMRAAYLPGSPAGYLSRRASSLDGIAAADLLAASDLLRSGLGEVRASVAGPDALDGASAWVASADPGARPSAADVRSETLGSGARILVQRNEDSDVFAVHVMFAPRSACEPPGKEGIADFLHRMLPRGTLVRDAAGLSAAFDALGARIKIVDDPAVPFDDYYTTPEFSFVRLEMPSERWREGVTLLGEMLRFPRLSADDIEAVRKEMLDLQKRQSESTRLVAQDLAARTLAPDQPLSRPVLGRAESIASITAEDLRAFHAAYFTGKRMILTAVGPIAPTDVADAVRATFGSMAAGEEAPARAVPPVTPEGSHAEAVVGKGQAYLDLAFVFDPDPKDLPALMVAGALLSDKLTFFLREEKGLAYSAGVSVAPWGGRTKFEAVMGTRQGNVDQALELMRSRLTELVRTEPEAAAVERAANALRGRGLMRRMSRINQAYFAGLDLLDGRAVGENLKRLEAIRAVTRDDVSRVMRGYLDPSRCAVMTVR